MDFAEVILFVSKFSKSSQYVVKYLTQYQPLITFPLETIMLDNEEVRSAVMNGPYFSIRNVPTLLVSTQDGSMKLYQGSEKIINYFAQLFSSIQARGHSSLGGKEEVEDEDDEEVLEDPPGEDVELLDDDEPEYVDQIGVMAVQQKPMSVSEQRASSLRSLASRMEAQRDKQMHSGETKMPPSMLTAKR